MLKYVLKRLVYSVLTIMVLMVITFFMMHAAPGNPFSTGKALDPVVMQNLYAKYGLDKPIWEQLVMYMVNAFQGDFGISIKYNRPVSKIIGEAFPYSLDLGLRALVIAVVFGIALGSVAAIRRGKATDTFAMIIAVIGVSVPSFIVAALLNFFVSFKLNSMLGTTIFPGTGWGSEMAKVLPSIALSFGSIATISRLMRTSMLDVLNSDYIKTAKAKGLSQRQILMRHALRNASMPVLTVLGPIAASLLTGAMVIEQVFDIPGLGDFFIKSIKEADYTMIAGTTLFYGIFLIVAILVVDVLYGVLDPRVKLSGGKE